MFNKVKLLIGKIKHTVPKETQYLVHYTEVSIPNLFKQNKPRQAKLNKAFNLYRQLGHVDKALSVRVVPDSVNNNGSYKYELVDEFTRWIVLSNNRVHYVPIKIVE